MTNLKVNSAYTPLFAIVLLFTLLFTACEQDNLNDLMTTTANSTLDATIATTDLADAEIVEMDMNALNEKINQTSTLESRSIRVPIFSETYSIAQGQWFGLYFNHKGLSAAHKYIAVVTPENGTPELMVYGYNPDATTYRHIRNAIQLEDGMKEVHFLKSDFTAAEARNYFYTYGTTASTFKIDIYAEETYDGSLNETEVTGRNVNFIKFTNSAGEFKGTFVQRTKKGQWEEEGTQQGQTRFTFQEVARDDWSVYLRDDSRGVNIQLDLHTKKVMYSDDNNPERRYLYTITERNAKTNGWIVSQVKFGGGADNFLGSFVKYDGDNWIEEGTTSGEARFKFKEVGRDEWSVYLHDASRGVNIQLDMHTKKVNYSDQVYTTPYTIYLIQDAI